MRLTTTTFWRLSLAVIALAVMLAGCSQGPGVPAEEAQAIAKEAYVYGFPVVMNYKTMYTYAVDNQNPEYKGPFNHLGCVARLFTPDDKAVVTPNADTPYCMFWMDLRAEPQVLTVPPLEPDRYYSFQLIDLYTHNFSYVGTLETGNGPGTFLIAGPDWDGAKPEGVTEVLRSETPFVFVVTRTQLFSPEDLDRVVEIQNSYHLQPLSAFLGTEAPPSQALPNFPAWVEGSQFDERYFSYLDFVMSLLGRPGEGEQQLWERIALLGIGPENTFVFDSLDPAVQEALRAGVKEGFGEMVAMIDQTKTDPLVSAKIFGTREFLIESARTNYGHANPYLIRAAAAQAGLYGNSGAEALYPTYRTDAGGQPLDASANRYTITFEDGSLPPVESFWSLTMYDGRTQLFVDNPLDRYLLNSTMMDSFRRGPDGSLVFYIQKDSPGAGLESNWLPAPDGPLYLVLRLYGPEPEALSGAWQPPQPVRVD